VEIWGAWLGELSVASSHDCRQSLKQICKGINMASISQHQGERGTPRDRIEFPCFIQVADVKVEISDIHHTTVFLWRAADQNDLKENFEITLGGTSLSVHVNFDDEGEVQSLTFKKDGKEMDIIDQETQQLAKKIERAFGVRKCKLVLDSSAR
jgi:hypothetical protein